MSHDQANWSPSPLLAIAFGLFWALFLIGMSIPFGPG